jgi:hypothetical protein
VFYDNFKKYSAVITHKTAHFKVIALLMTKFPIATLESYFIKIAAE